MDQSRVPSNQSSLSVMTTWTSVSSDLDPADRARPRWSGRWNPIAGS